MLLYYLSLIDNEEDKSKFEKIYEEYRLLMKYIALKVLGNDKNAEDVVHDAFVKIIKHLNQIEDVYSHKTRSFIVIIVKNTAIDYTRKEKKSRYVDIEKVYDTKVSSAASNITEELSAKEILSKLKQLPDKYREILELKVYHQLSDKQTADLLNISHAAVRKRLQRAREALDALINE